MSWERTMQRHWVGPLAAFLLLSTIAATPAASTEADFKTALAAAEAANNQAGALRNQWTTTTQALAAAKKAAAAGNYDDAVREAKHAEALAKASIAQAQEQDENWRDAKIR
jgi:hypothetical protein